MCCLNSEIQSRTSTTEPRVRGLHPLRKKLIDEVFAYAEYNDVSVKKICTDAGVSRSLFAPRYLREKGHQAPNLEVVRALLGVIGGHLSDFYGSLDGPEAPT